MATFLRALTGPSTVRECEFCKKPAEFQVTSENSGGMGPDAWPVCAKHIGNVEEMVTATGVYEGQDGANVVMVARIANNKDPEEIDRQAARMHKAVSAEDDTYNFTVTFNRMRDAVKGGRTHITLSMDEIYTVIRALSQAQQQVG